MRRRSGLSLALVALAAMVGASPARADDATIALDGFAGLCLEEGADYAKVAERAALAGWTPIAKEKLALVGPRTPPEAVQGWLTRVPDFPTDTAIGITRGHYNGKVVQTCTMFLKQVDVASFESVMLDRLKPRRTDKDDDGVRESHVYDLKAGGQHLVIVLSFPLDHSDRAFSVGAVSER